MTKNILSVRDITRIYKISRQTIERAVKAGKLEKRRFANGRKIYFYQEDIEKLFK